MSDFFTFVYESTGQFWYWPYNILESKVIPFHGGLDLYKKHKVYHENGDVFGYGFTFDEINQIIKEEQKRRFKETLSKFTKELREGYTNENSRRPERKSQEES